MGVYQLNFENTNNHILDPECQLNFGRKQGFFKFVLDRAKAVFTNYILEMFLNLFSSRKSKVFCRN